MIIRLRRGVSKSLEIVFSWEIIAHFHDSEDGGGRALRYLCLFDCPVVLSTKFKLNVVIVLLTDTTVYSISFHLHL